MSSEGPTIEGLDQLQRIAAAALGDEAYRRRLVSRPTDVLRDEGLTVPDEVRVTVHVNTSDHVHLVLPTGIEEAKQISPGETDITRLQQLFLF